MPLNNLLGRLGVILPVRIFIPALDVTFTDLRVDTVRPDGTFIGIFGDVAPLRPRRPGAARRCDHSAAFAVWSCVRATVSGHDHDRCTRREGRESSRHGRRGRAALPLEDS
ncbi:MAG: hypothetical protein R3F43_23370 [bacterium]